MMAEQGDLLDVGRLEERGYFFERHVSPPKYCFAEANAVLTASSVICLTLMFLVDCESPRSTSTFKETGLAPSASAVMLSVSMFFEGTLDKMCFRAASSALRQSSSICLSVSSSRPSSSTGCHPERRTSC